MKRLPALKGLASDISSARTTKRQRISDSISFLTGNSASLQGFSGIEGLAEAAYDSDPSDATAKAVVHHLVTVRSEMARQLWKRDLFVGVTTLDELLLYHVASGSSDPVLATLRTLQAAQLNKPGMLVFPLHSFGIYAAGLLQPFRGEDISLVNRSQGFVVIPQTNRIDKTIQKLAAAGREIGAKKQIDGDLIRHFRDSRDARWLEHNPLLVVGVRSTSGMYYENEFLLLGRVRAITASLVMLAALQPHGQGPEATFFSSSSVNNCETLDIDHYITLTAGQTKFFRADIIPIHQRRAVAELSDLAIEIDPRFWGGRAVLERRVYQAVDGLYRGYMSYSLGSAKETSRGRVYRKLFEAVSYFRRSYTGKGEGWTSVVSLATAFEMLLTDSYEPGVARRLRRRTQALLRGVRGTQKYQQAVEDLYHCRSQTVHSGFLPDFKLESGREAFVLVFCALMDRIPTLSAKQDNPMAFLTGVN